MPTSRKLKHRVDLAKTTAIYLFMANVALVIFYFIFRSRNGQQGASVGSGAGLLIYLIKPQNSPVVNTANILIKDSLEKITYEASTFDGLLRNIKLFLENHFANVGLVPIEIVNTKILSDEENRKLRVAMDFGTPIQYH